MFRHILVPTDGSALSQDAVEYGITLAKAANAKITVTTVSTPFQTFAVDPGLLAESPDQYRIRTKALAANYLGVANDMAATAGVSCHTIHVEHDHPYQAIIRYGDTAELRSHRDGLAWPAGHFRHCTWERDVQGTYPQHGPGLGASYTTTINVFYGFLSGTYLRLASDANRLITHRLSGLAESYRSIWLSLPVSGKVDSWDERETVENAAWSVAGVQSVDDRLTIVR